MSNKSLEPLFNEDYADDDGLKKRLRIISAQSDTAVNGSVTVGSSTTSILAANSQRIRALLVNDSDETIYVSLGATAVMNKGIRLNASGGMASIGEYTGAISGICASGGKNLTTCEY